MKDYNPDKSRKCYAKPKKLPREDLCLQVLVYKIPRKGKPLENERGAADA